MLLLFRSLSWVTPWCRLQWRINWCTLVDQSWQRKSWIIPSDSAKMIFYIAGTLALETQISKVKGLTTRILLPVISWLGVSPMTQVVKNLPVMQETQETQVWSLHWEGPLEKDMATHSGSLAWKNSMDRRAWQATVHMDTKSWTQLSTHTHICTSTFIFKKILCRHP